ncbi:PH domain-containing protein [Nocardioides campestrisoli]|uniref:PH domain-containing protein n=1 Tax=Nocardioides campestrisoli TaxID=2736757 RepID=UPI0015E79533|nr:PH domain-containing protein [Nocardioides campestrisoli]
MNRPAEGAGWQRLSARKLLIDPVSVLRSFLLPLIAVVVGLSTSDRPVLTLIALPVFLVGAVVLGVIPWLTTWFRLDEEQYQQRTGLLNTKTSTVRLDRIRSVDLEGPLLHRMLGLRKVQIGTGVDDERIVLDAVTVEQAERLRTTLLARRRAAAPPQVPGAAGPDDLDSTAVTGEDSPYPPAMGAPDVELLATLDPTWARFAPFSLARLVIVASAFGFLTQVLDDFPVIEPDDVQDAVEWVTGYAIVVVVAGLVTVALVAWIVLSTLGYLAQWWGLRVTRYDGSLHRVSGLVTTRSISVEEQRVRGVRLEEKVLLRVVGGAELSILATGIDAGSAALLPPCPTGVAAGVGGRLLGDERPLAVALTQHGPRARRRAHVRSQWLTLTALVVLVVLHLPQVTSGPRDWLPDWATWSIVPFLAVLGVVLAEATYAHLGHALTEHHLVVGSGSSTRTRTVLERDGIIGWVVEQSFFQRRAGLATLTATTAAAPERVVLRDVPLGRAVSLADEATPGLLDPFLT